MNKDAEKWIKHAADRAEDCSAPTVADELREAMRWAYADASSQVESAYWRRYCEDEGTSRHVDSIKMAIMERAA